MADSAWSQGYVEIVRSGSVIHTSTSISGAISGAPGGLVAGDQVLIQGLINGSGAPRAYSTTTTGESFPLAFPSGVTVKPRDSVAVYIVAAAGSGVTHLVTVTPVSGTPPVTRLEKLNLAGAEVAVLLQTANGNQNLDVILDKVFFGRNSTGLSSIASGGTVKVQVKDCKIVDGVPVQDPAPINRLFSVGLEFRAQDTDGKVEATIDNFSTFGLFTAAQMKPIAFSRLAYSHDMTPYATEITRLIEIYAASTLGGGDPGEHDTNFAILPVPRVILIVNGGALDGKAYQGDAGWDVGLYADTSSGGTVILDYFAYWEAVFNGTTLRNFKAAGIYGEVTVETRGLLRLNDVLVEKIGFATPSTPGETFKSGVHLVTQESYLAFEADNSEFLDNRGNGIYLMANSAIQSSDLELPTGLYVDLDHCEIHGNSLSGLFLDAGPDKPHFSHNQGAIVGGTYDYYPIATRIEKSLIWEGNEPDGRLPRGQGVVNGCAVSNNGEYGIRLRALGDFSEGNLTAISVRFVNDYVWNNPLGGYYAKLEPFINSPFLAPALFAPLVHCTFAENHSGGVGGWSVEIDPVTVSGSPPARLFFWDDYPSLADNRVLGTSINNCVFQRPLYTDPDFGPKLETFDVFDTNPPGSFWYPAPDLVPWAGIRGRIVNLASDGVFSTNLASPFFGPINPTNRAVGQFFLDNTNQTDPKFFFSHSYIRAGFSLTEDVLDYEGFTRPALALRDKGGEED